MLQCNMLLNAGLKYIECRTRDNGLQSLGFQMYILKDTVEKAIALNYYVLNVVHYIY